MIQFYLKFHSLSWILLPHSPSVSPLGCCNRHLIFNISELLILPNKSHFLGSLLSRQQIFSFYWLSPKALRVIFSSSHSQFSVGQKFLLLYLHIMSRILPLFTTVAAATLVYTVISCLAYCSRWSPYIYVPLYCLFWPKQSVIVLKHWIKSNVILAQNCGMAPILLRIKDKFPTMAWKDLHDPALLILWPHSLLLSSFIQPHPAWLLQSFLNTLVFSHLSVFFPLLGVLFLGTST